MKKTKTKKPAPKFRRTILPESEDRDVHSEFDREFDRNSGMPEPIRPNPGKQEMFLSTAADVAFYGGGRGGGKTFALALDPMRHVGVPEFGGAILRRTYPQITEIGGLWDTARKIYPLLLGTARETQMDYRFPSGAVIRFAHLEHDRHLDDWKGAQVAFIGVDQIEQFSKRAFFDLLSANRSTSGVRPYLRATCNPDPDSWLMEFLDWWIDEDGFPIEERAGILRYFRRNPDTDEIDWFDEKVEGSYSFTFIPALLDDNPKLTEKDPEYDTRLLLLPRVERLRMRYGNWRVKETAGNVFAKEDFVLVDAIDASQVVARVRSWDKAGTEGGGKWSVGVKIALLRLARGGHQFAIEDVVRGQWSSLKRERMIAATRDLDELEDPDCDVLIEQEPGSGGKESAESTVRNLAGSTVKAERPTGSKLARARPYAVQVEANNVLVLKKEWTKEFLDEHHNFDHRADKGTIVCDQVDAAAAGFNFLAKQIRNGPMAWGSTPQEKETVVDRSREELIRRGEREGWLLG